MLYRIPVRNIKEGYYIRWYFNGWHYWMFYPGNQNMITNGKDYRTTGSQSVQMGTGNLSLSEMEALRTLLKSKTVFVLSGTLWKEVRISAGSQVIFSNDVDGYEMELIINSDIDIQLSTVQETTEIEYLTDDSGSILTDDSLEIIQF
jgi:hypothetical protein